MNVLINIRLPYAIIEEKVAREYENQCETIEDSVTHLTEGGFEVPFIGDICETIFRELYYDEKLDLIYEAIQRRDDDLFNFSSQNDFHLAAWSNELNDPSLQPQVALADVESHVVRYLLEHQFFFIDFNHIVRNSPIKEVW